MSTNSTTFTKVVSKSEKKAAKKLQKQHAKVPGSKMPVVSTSPVSKKPEVVKTKTLLKSTKINEVTMQEAIVDCPLCFKPILFEHINNHMDTGCNTHIIHDIPSPHSSGPPSPKTPSGVSYAKIISSPGKVDPQKIKQDFQDGLNNVNVMLKPVKAKRSSSSGTSSPRIEEAASRPASPKPQGLVKAVSGPQVKVASYLVSPMPQAKVRASPVIVPIFRGPKPPEVKRKVTAPVAVHVIPTWKDPELPEDNMKEPVDAPGDPSALNKKMSKREKNAAKKKRQQANKKAREPHEKPKDDGKNALEKAVAQSQKALKKLGKKAEQVAAVAAPVLTKQTPAVPKVQTPAKTVQEKAKILAITMAVLQKQKEDREAQEAEKARKAAFSPVVWGGINLHPQPSPALQKPRAASPTGSTASDVSFSASVLSQASGFTFAQSVPNSSEEISTNQVPIVENAAEAPRLEEKQETSETPDLTDHDSTSEDEGTVDSSQIPTETVEVNSKGPVIGTGPSLDQPPEPIQDHEQEDQVSVKDAEIVAVDTGIKIDTEEDFDQDHDSVHNDLAIAVGDTEKTATEATTVELPLDSTAEVQRDEHTLDEPTGTNDSGDACGEYEDTVSFSDSEPPEEYLQFGEVSNFQSEVEDGSAHPLDVSLPAPDESERILLEDSADSKESLVSEEALTSMDDRFADSGLILENLEEPIADPSNLIEEKVDLIQPTNVSLPTPDETERIFLEDATESEVSFASEEFPSPTEDAIVASVNLPKALFEEPFVTAPKRSIFERISGSKQKKATTLVNTPKRSLFDRIDSSDNARVEGGFAKFQPVVDNVPKGSIFDSVVSSDKARSEGIFAHLQSDAVEEEAESEPETEEEANEKEETQSEDEAVCETDEDENMEESDGSTGETSDSLDETVNLAQPTSRNGNLKEATNSPTSTVEQVFVVEPVKKSQSFPTASPTSKNGDGNEKKSEQFKSSRSSSANMSEEELEELELMTAIGGVLLKDFLDVLEEYSDKNGRVSEMGVVNTFMRASELRKSAEGRFSRIATRSGRLHHREVALGMTPDSNRLREQIYFMQNTFLGLITMANFFDLLEQNTDGSTDEDKVFDAFVEASKKEKATKARQSRRRARKAASRSPTPA